MRRSEFVSKLITINSVVIKSFSHREGARLVRSLFEQLQSGWCCLFSGSKLLPAIVSSSHLSHEKKELSSRRISSDERWEVTGATKPRRWLQTSAYILIYTANCKTFLLSLIRLSFRSAIKKTTPTSAEKFCSVVRKLGRSQMMEICCAIVRAARWKGGRQSRLTAHLMNHESEECVKWSEQSIS